MKEILLGSWHCKAHICDKDGRNEECKFCEENGVWENADPEIIKDLQSLGLA